MAGCDIMENIPERWVNHGRIAYPSNIDTESSPTMRKLVQHNSQNWRMPGTKLDGTFHGSILSAPTGRKSSRPARQGHVLENRVANSKHCVE
jgi:hypothetical protein